MTTIMIKYAENYLKRTFKDWSMVELESYLKELEDKHKNNTLTRDEALWVQPIREEIERRKRIEKEG